MVLLILSTQLLPVQARGGRSERGWLGQGGQRIDVESAIVRMLLAKVVAGMDLGLAAGQDLLQLLDEVLQVLAGKFPTEPKHQSCYLAHGGESLGNLVGSLEGDLAKRDSTSFFVFRQVRCRSSALQARARQATLPQKISSGSPQPHGVPKGGESRNTCFAQAIQQISRLEKRSF